MSLVRAKSALAIYCLCALAAQGQERLTSKDLSFFEYLGSMVEKDGAWVDPLDMENADLARLEGEEQADDADVQEDESTKKENAKQFASRKVQR